MRPTRETQPALDTLAAGLCDRPDLLVHVLCCLTRSDAARLAACCRAFAAAVRCLDAPGGSGAAQSAAVYRPRLFVACSGTSKLVEVPLDGGEPAVAHCIRKPPPPRKRTAAGAGARPARSRARATPSWPTSIAFNPRTRHLHVCQYAVSGVMALAAPSAPSAPSRGLRRRGGAAGATRRAQPARRVVASQRALAGPEGLAFASNGFLYVVTINGTLVQLDAASGALLSSSPLPQASQHGDAPQPWALVPWGMAAWPPPGPAPPAAPAASIGPAHGVQHAAGVLATDAAGASTELLAGATPEASDGEAAGAAPAKCLAAAEPAAPGGAAATRAVAAAFESRTVAAASGSCARQLFIAAELDYDSREYTDPPPAGATDGRIMAAELAADGAVSCWRRFTPPTVKLPRPSGVCFDASGDLWVTCIGDGGAVVQVAGPRRAAPGAELRRFATSSLHAACPAAKPWDVCCIPARGGGGAEGTEGEGALLAVSLHAGKRGGPGAVALLRVVDGVLVRLVMGSLLDGEPNMMALQV